MTPPTTEAGRTLIAAFVTPLPKDAIELSARGLIASAVPAIEAEAVAKYAAELAARLPAALAECEIGCWDIIRLVGNVPEHTHDKDAKRLMAALLEPPR